MYHFVPLTIGMFHLNKKNEIVTGWERGIGRAITKVFASQEARVYILDMDEQAGDAVVK